MTKNSLPFDILLLEDEPADAYLIKVALEEGKMLANLHRVVDGREGLDFLRHKEQFTDAPRPDLILLDFNMPRMNGREFLAEIKADPLLNDIPVIVLTTSNVERDVVASYQLGAASFITKPLDMSQFITAIHHIESYWFTLVRLPQSHK